ncbi:hypothetical protein SH2C18_28480 [Clostridium sediminicola]|uniref:BlaI/MecI/CopY family transcriptional regulator n=1 Tax=Clostridium sediminicola TaxID=3114879 RepID=UPI0031F26E26
MSIKSKRLSDAELEIMLVVWHSEQPVSSSYILERLQGRRNWALPTLMTVLTRLIKKGYLNCEKKGRNNFYYSVIEENDYKESEGKSILEKLYGNSFKNFVTALYNGKAISTKDINELREFIDRVEKEE